MCRQVRSSVAGRSACGFFCRKVSLKRKAISASVQTPNSVTASSAARQPYSCDRRPPSGALMQASTPRPLKPLDMMRAPSVGG